MPTPEPRYETFIVDGIGVSVPVNISLDNCIDVPEIDRCVDYFWIGTAGIDFPRYLDLSDNDVVVPIGDIDASSGEVVYRQNESCTVDGIYVLANYDAHNLNTYPANMLSGTYNGPEEIYEDAGVFIGMQLPDEGNHITMEFGYLTIEGLEECMINVTSTADDPTRWDWNGIVFHEGFIDYAIIEYSRTVEPGSLGGLPSPSATMSNSIVRHTGGAGIWINSVRNLLIENNLIYDAAIEGIGGVGDQNHIIRGNTIEYPHLQPWGGNVCVVVNDPADTAPEISGNTFIGCVEGIAFLESPQYSIQEFIDANIFNVLVRPIETP